MRQLNKAVNAQGSLRGAEALCAAYGGTLAYFTSAGEAAAAKEKSSFDVIRESFFFFSAPQKPNEQNHDAQKGESDDATCLEVSDIDRVPVDAVWAN